LTSSPRAEQGRLAVAGQDGRRAEGQLVLDLTMQAIQASLDGIAARQRITSQNLANAETPGYIAQTVSFEENLLAALESGDPADFSITTGATSDPVNFVGNNVSVDVETVNLVDIGLRYQLATESMNNKFRLLREGMRRDF
jgi:flagellar basal-body rod protein FlgB